jgi:hypothetical protein
MDRNRTWKAEDTPVGDAAHHAAIPENERSHACSNPRVQFGQSMSRLARLLCKVVSFFGTSRYGGNALLSFGYFAWADLCVLATE